MAEVAMYGKARDRPALPAMMMWISVTVVFAALVLALVRVVRADGLGHRRPPASHAEWSKQL